MNGTADTEMKVTPARLVLPFYLYAALSFLACTLLLFLSGESLSTHYFHPHTLAITHIAALGWGTMIILGASHQLLPVFTGHHLFSPALARLSFFLAATGIPLLVHAFYIFNFGWPAVLGGAMVLVSVACFVVNVTGTIFQATRLSLSNAFVFSASLWLLLTVTLGWLLVLNFRYPILPAASLEYLSLHAHIGVVGWFLLMVMGVASRLLPMFLLSKYAGTRLLRAVFFLVNAGLIAFILQFFIAGNKPFVIPISALLLAFALFALFCQKAFRSRIRKRIDAPMKISLLSVGMMILPFGVLALILFLSAGREPKLLLLYGFLIFFGWLTAIILGMTFKTLPFIIWNRHYEPTAGLQPAPSPQELFSHRIFRLMILGYLSGFLLFIAGIWLGSRPLLTVASGLLLAAAVLYNCNVIKLFIHKPARR